MSFALRYTSGDVQVLGLRSDRPQRLMGSAAMACVAFACTWTLAVNLTGPRAGAIDVSGTIFDAIEHTAPRGDKLVVTAPSPLRGSRLVSKSDAPLFDARFTMGSAAQSFAANAPDQPRGWSVATTAPVQGAIEAAPDTKSAPVRDARIVQDAVPLPQPAPQTRTAALRDGAHRVVANAVADTRSIWDKLFGRPASALTLAYAGAETGSLGSGHNSALGLYDRSTAVYDITAHKVYLPDGTALEAHSGLGALLDDPRHADVKMRGVTPPAVYDLQPREALFHGVEALRLIPEDETQALGRDGLLAHSYMLGPNGDSNGCVSFRDYEAFLQAYKNHEITRLAVVARLD
jgi:type VI secretion system (T6SS) effector TldE1-like protein